VTYVLHDDSIWSAVDHKPKRASGRELARVRFLRRRPEATLTVDHYTDDWDALAWVQVLGRARVQAVADEPQAVSALRAKYERYREHSPPGPLIRLTPERFLFWRASD
jgi:PPOX class probable F420-dependent enzyme